MISDLRKLLRRNYRFLKWSVSVFGALLVSVLKLTQKKLGKRLCLVFQNQHFSKLLKIILPIIKGIVGASSNVLGKNTPFLKLKYLL